MVLMGFLSIAITEVKKLYHLRIQIKARFHVQLVNAMQVRVKFVVETSIPGYFHVETRQRCHIGLERQKVIK